jgi:UDP-N-acetylmuramoyl-tripeptide--D-alanyl-D-alanine ligase
MQWTVDHIVQATSGRLLGGSTNRVFHAVGIDSRSILPGQLFVAICGGYHDGHSFIRQVLDKGVRGAVIQEDHAAEEDLAALQASGAVCVAVRDTTRALGNLAVFQRLRHDIPVVAITGSNGKTSTRQMTELVLSQRYVTLATQGNFNNEIGLPLTLFNLDQHHQAAVFELGMNHFGEMDRLGAVCKPTIAMITNVASAHLEFLGSLEGVAQAKGELVPHIRESGTLVLNADDPHVKALGRKARCKVMYFGTSAGAQVRAEAIAVTDSGIAFNLVLPLGRIRVAMTTPGRFMVFNALAAACAGFLTGLGLDEIRQGLERFTAAKGRLCVKTTGRGVHLIDDTYNANPDSVTAALETLAAMKGAAPAYIALGDMLELGDQAARLHAYVGERAATIKAVKLYLFGPHANDTAAGARRAGMAGEDILVGSKEEIADDLNVHLQPGDWLLVKGSRGMAMETVVEAVCK